MLWNNMRGTSGFRYCYSKNCLCKWQTILPILLHKRASKSSFKYNFQVMRTLICFIALYEFKFAFHLEAIVAKVLLTRELTGLGTFSILVVMMIGSCHLIFSHYCPAFIWCDCCRCIYYCMTWYGEVFSITFSKFIRLSSLPAHAHCS